MDKLTPIPELLSHIEDTERRKSLATNLNGNPDYLWQIATGRRKASHALAKQIELKTNGAITRQMLRPDIFGEVPKPQRKQARA